MAVRLVVVVFPIYGLLYGGVTVILAAFFGFWASRSKYIDVTRVYYVLVIPILLVTVLHSTGSCIELIPRVSHEVDAAEVSGVLRLDEFLKNAVTLPNPTTNPVLNDPKSNAKTTPTGNGGQKLRRG